MRTSPIAATPRGAHGRTSLVVRRLAAIMVALDRFPLGLTVSELARTADVSKRQVYRYLAAFEVAGLPLVRDELGRWAHFVPKEGRG